MDRSELIKIRDYKEQDTAYVLSTWLHGLYFGNDWFGLIIKDSYYRHYHYLLEKLISKPTIQIKVACLKEDEDVILGYSVYEKDRLDWVQVKAVWRNIGIARSLVPKEITKVSHLTRTGKTLLIRKKLKFDPFSV